MITEDSRYAEAVHEFPLTHHYDALGKVEMDSDTKKPITDSRNTTYLLTTKQHSSPHQQYMVKQTDNIQLLAYRALRDPSQWWVIADANPHIRYPLNLKMGDTIHLPE